MLAIAFYDLVRSPKHGTTNVLIFAGIVASGLIAWHAAKISASR